MSSHQYPEKNRYSAINPPPSIEVANARLEQIALDMVQIDVDLKHIKVDHYDSEDDYLDWHRRASAALVHMTLEKKFLLNWREKKIAEKHSQEFSGKKKILVDCVVEFLGQIKFAPQFTSTKLPKDREEADSRMKDLLAGLMVLGAKINELRAKGEESGLNIAIIQKVLVPVQKVVSDANLEVTVIKRYIASLNRGGFLSLPQPSSDPALAGILTEIAETKKELQMNAVEMLSFVFGLLEENLDSIVLRPEDKKVFDTISRYVRLTERRKKIQGQDM